MLPGSTRHPLQASNQVPQQLGAASVANAGAFHSRVSMLECSRTMGRREGQGLGLHGKGWRGGRKEMQEADHTQMRAQAVRPRRTLERGKWTKSEKQSLGISQTDGVEIGWANSH